MLDQNIANQEPSTDTLTGVLAELVGPDRKFKSVEDLARGKHSADLYINKLEGENKDLRSLLEQATNNNDRQALLEKLMTQVNTDPTQNTNTNQQSTEDNQPKGLSAEEVVKLIEERDNARKAQANYETAVADIRKVHGEKTNEFLAAKAAELGLPIEALHALAQSSPKAFLNTIGYTTNINKSTSMATGGVNSQAVFGGSSADKGVRNKSYYDNLQKEMGTLKFVMDKQTQVQLHKDMVALGDAWYA